VGFIEAVILIEQAAYWPLKWSGMDGPLPIWSFQRDRGAAKQIEREQAAGA
jgi:hypothetical protein